MASRPEVDDKVRRTAEERSVLQDSASFHTAMSRRSLDQSHEEEGHDEGPHGEQSRQERSHVEQPTKPREHTTKTPAPPRPTLRDRLHDKASRSGQSRRRSAIESFQSHRQQMKAQSTERRSSLHKMLGSIFSAVSPGEMPSPTTEASPQRSPFAPSGGTPRGSIREYFAQSLEVVGPGAFLFSSPRFSEIEYDNSLSRTSSLQVPSIKSVSVRTSEGVMPAIHRATSFSTGVGSFSEGSILDPCLGTSHTISRRVSDVLLRHENDVLQEFEEELDEVAHGRSVSFPEALLSALKSAAVCSISPMTSLPAEIISDILGYLSPLDFNAARRTCRTWMRASLSRHLLVQQLKLGGWLSGADRELKSYRERLTIEEAPSAGDEEWLLSRIIARECSVSHGWTGNGLPSQTPTESPPAAFLRTSETDFADLSNGYAGPQGRHGSGLIFQVSVCSRFVLVAESAVIYVYELCGDKIVLVSSVVCPKRVLAMSMDTTGGRYAIAALMDGRMGLVCELIARPKQTGAEPEGSLTDEELMESLSKDMDANSSSCQHPYVERRSAEIKPSSSGFAPGYSNFPETSRIAQGRGSSIPQLEAIDVQNSSRSFSLRGTTDETSRARNLINRSWNLLLPNNQFGQRGSAGSLPANLHSGHCDFETGPRTIYRNVCSEDDPPRSVAISPQRRCVAFGCANGIELHWIDAIDGLDYNRWFPLTSPSDHLYFILARPGLDTSKKLRIISSAAHPSLLPALSRRFYPSRASLAPSILNISQTNPLPHLPASSQNRSLSVSGGLTIDHFRAVPLADGYHFLYTDPHKNTLWLGADAPAGRLRLCHKVALIPPATLSTAKQFPLEPLRSTSAASVVVPVIYAAAADLTFGVRVVAVYADTIVLFSVPPDPGSPSLPERRSPMEAAAAVWPRCVLGVVVGELDGIVDVAVGTELGVPGAALTVWAFGVDGRAAAFELGSRPRDGLSGGEGERSVLRRVIRRDGEVEDLGRGDAENEMVARDTLAWAGEEDGASLVGGTRQEGKMVGKKGSRSTYFDGTLPQTLREGEEDGAGDCDVEVLDTPSLDDGYLVVRAKSG
ncbi:hypothetical protein BDY21DRAFT_325207 [Lineolata rhizophorae]|uniref:F-box domain-containing protein n=1 Tax=Lineolata rhizophorae TaxID=578093 RepID=A0A6A6NTF1_9PEZI|nr:hypothetical protein BDY21DRAFT_325207 [Lineolata rhizophorae]